MSPVLARVTQGDLDLKRKVQKELWPNDQRYLLPADLTKSSISLLDYSFSSA